MSATFGLLGVGALMSCTALMLAVVVVVPVLSVGLELTGGSNISERHHSHHDTYVASSASMRALVVGMVFMGGVGLILAWLCGVGVFDAHPNVVLGFFSSFLAVCFALWFAMRRYRVVTYDDYMVVTPFVGRTVRISYDQITSMRWHRSWIWAGPPSVDVLVGGRRVAYLWGGLDTDEILMRIDRYDVLA